MNPLPAAVPPAADEATQATRTRGRRSAAPRMLRLELRRARAVVVLVLVVLLCAFPVLDSDGLWPGRWLQLTMHLRASTTGFVLPVVAAVAVWRGQRGHRSGTGDLLASTPRPRSHPLMLDWLTVTLPAAAGVLAVWCAAAMAPSLTAEPGRLRAPWLGGHWELVLIALLAGLAAAAAVGLALGRSVGSRLAAPVVAVAVFVAISIAGSVQTRLAWLTPALRAPEWVSDTIPAGASLLQIGFFIGVTVAALTAAHLARRSGASRRAAVTAIVPALAVTAACAVPLVSGSGRIVTDAAALLPACTRDAPVVCVHQANSFHLGDITAQLRPLLSVVAATGGPTDVGLEHPSPVRADLAPSDDQTSGEQPLHDRPVVRLNLGAGLDGRLAGNLDANWLDEHSFARAFTDSGRCRKGGEATGPGSDRDWHRAEPIATDLLLHEAGPGLRTGPVPSELGPAVEALHQRLAAESSAERRRWLTRYFRARSTCDVRAVAALVNVP